VSAPILVTGSHRSGTTWVGRMLDASGETAYVHEPFNPNRSPGWFPEALPHWFMYITTENESAYLEPVQRLVELRYPVGRALVGTRRARVLAMNLQQSALAARDRMKRKRLLLKDPMALFSAEWLAERFGFTNVVLIRHPASFVSSIKRLDWGFDYERNWLGQPLLMRDLLPAYGSRFAGYRGEEDIVGEGIVVWNAMYEVVSGYRDRHPDWSFVRYEDLAAEPKSGFRRLYGDLGLTWTDAAQQEIARHSHSSNPSDVAPSRKHELKRDSKGAASTWHARLTAAEIDRIRAETEPVWRRFYADEEWEAPSPSPG
jgi:hypothetical protein